MALPGDLIVVSGDHGLSRLGLAILQSDPALDRYNFSTEFKKQAILNHQRPQPPLNALLALEKCKPQAIACQAAGTDSSDGLFEAIQGICISSKCQAILKKENLPKPKEWPIGNYWDYWCLNGGEDFELVLSLPEKWAHHWINEVPTAKCIGRIEAGEPRISWDNGKEIKNKDLNLFEHF